MAESDPLLLALDAGSTHLKAALFDAHGDCCAESSLPTPIRLAAPGYRTIDPAELWQAAVHLIELLGQAFPLRRVAGVGIASMAESGLLVDRVDGEARSPMFPWFDTHSAAAAARLAQAAPTDERFLLSGIYPSYKCSLAKIVWAQQTLGLSCRGACWLSAADYLAFGLSGEMFTDYSLAGRTYAFRIIEKTWDGDWLAALDLPRDLFPEARQAGQGGAVVSSAAAALTGLPAGIAVSVAGHDHVCAAMAVGATRSGVVLDSLGTAEALAGALPLQPLTARELQSGFSISCHVAAGRLCWIGGLSASGGSLEWLRSLWPAAALDYDDLIEALADAPDAPGEILYYPYLSGSSSPQADSAVRGAFLGLSATHRLGHLVRAVLEGTAYEVEYLRRRAQHLTGDPLSQVRVTGGGVRNRPWMQIKADVSGCRFEEARTPQAVLLGAALVAGLAAAIYPDVDTAVSHVARASEYIFTPQPERHTRYRRVYEQGFLPMKAAVISYHPTRFFSKESES